MVAVMVVMLSVFGDMTLCAEILPELESAVKWGLLTEKQASEIFGRCEKYAEEQVED